MDGITVEIWMKRTWGSDVGIIRVVCESADFNYRERKVGLVGVKQIGSPSSNLLPVTCSGGWVEYAVFIVELPPNNKYKIQIGKQEHILLPIVKQ